MIKRQRFARAGSLAIPLGMLVSPVQAGNVIETMHEVSDSGQFEIDEFATALEAAGLASELEGPGSYTIFAPTNEAFQRLKLGGAEPQATRSSGRPPIVAGRHRDLRVLQAAHAFEQVRPWAEARPPV